jgi:glycosyltransferase involved in cell wall biosynthesis
MSRKKVLILGKLPPPYMGPAVATEIILRSKLKEEFELIHLDTRVNTSLSSFGKWSFGKIMKNLALYRRMRALMKQKPDLVLIPVSQTTTGFLKDSVFIRIAHRYKAKILIHLRGSQFKAWVESTSASNQTRVKKTLAKTQGVIVLGEKLRYIFENYYPKEKIFVVPNGSNYSFPAKNKSKETKVLYFSNLLAAKGVVDVLLAAEMLAGKTSREFSVDLVGAWHLEKDKEACAEILQRSKLPVRIHAASSGTEKFQFFADADVFVFPPREPEGHPWAIVEAMAAGLPIISTDKGAITESVLDGQNGFIVEPGQPAQIAEKLKSLIENEELRNTMGHASRNLYLSNFTEEKMVENLASVFNKMIES